MKALIAVDGSESSWDAVTFAARFLGEGDETMVVNVTSQLDPVVVPAGALPGYAAAGYGIPGLTARGGDGQPQRSTERMEDRARSIADQAAAEVNADFSAVEVGGTVERICSVAAENDVDLIVVGTHDPGLFERIFTGGSVSRDIVDKAPCSVLVVR